MRASMDVKRAGTIYLPMLTVHNHASHLELPHV